MINIGFGAFLLWVTFTRKGLVFLSFQAYSTGGLMSFAGTCDHQVPLFIQVAGWTALGSCFVRVRASSVGLSTRLPAPSHEWLQDTEACLESTPSYLESALFAGRATRRCSAQPRACSAGLNWFVQVAGLDDSVFENSMITVSNMGGGRISDENRCARDQLVRKHTQTHTHTHTLARTHELVHTRAGRNVWKTDFLVL
jgi:hypothetical protein